MIMYRSDRSAVEAREVSTAGDKWIIQPDGTREARSSQWAVWFETEAEAVEFTRKQLSYHADMLSRQLDRAREALAALDPTLSAMECPTCGQLNVV